MFAQSRSSFSQKFKNLTAKLQSFAFERVMIIHQFHEPTETKRKQRDERTSDPLLCLQTLIRMEGSLNCHRQDKHLSSNSSIGKTPTSRLLCARDCANPTTQHISFSSQIDRVPILVSQRGYLHHSHTTSKELSTSAV